MRSLVLRYSLILLLVGCFVDSQTDNKLFLRTRLYKVDVQNKLEDLKNLTTILGLEAVNTSDHAHSYYVVMNPSQQQTFESGLNTLRCIFEVRSINPMKTLDACTANLTQPKMEWTQYHSLQDIYEWLDYQVAKHPFLATSHTIGYSYEGRPIKALKMSRKRGNKAVFIECNIHAIEWIASATCTCFLNNLLNSPSGEMQHLRHNYDWIIVPMMNTDGFTYTREVNRLWRKNRKPTGFSNFLGICYGTDMNRNFDSEWRAAGYHNDVSCDHWYSGPAADSEPEVRALEHLISFYNEGYFRIYLAIHAFGNYLLLPYGYTTEILPPNHLQILNISKAFADAARIKYGTEFTYGSSGQLNYAVSGSSKDWAYGTKNIPFTATIELRDKGHYGFFLPADQIVEVCNEFSDGIVGMLKGAEAEQLFN